MSTLPKNLADLHSTVWESEGIERAEGLRTFLPKEEPPCENFNYAFRNFQKDMATFVDAVEAWLLPQQFTPFSGIMLWGDDAATLGALTGAAGNLVPVVQFAPGIYQECQVTARVKRNNASSTPQNAKVRLFWCTSKDVSKAAEFVVKYLAAGDGQAVTGTVSAIAKEAADSATPYGRVVTEVDLPVLVQGKTLILSIAHDGANGSDEIDATLNLLAIEVI